MDTRNEIHAILVAPVQEEVAKFFSFLLAYKIIIKYYSSNQKFSEIRKSKGVFTLGAFVGLSVAVLENIIDYGNITPIMTFLRAISSWPIHILTAGLSAYGFNKFQGLKKFIFLGLAILIHMVSNMIRLYLF